MWDILGIAATADERAIRRAYAARLKALGRTPDPQQFARLRQAYEQALYEAEHGTPEAQEWANEPASDEDGTAQSDSTLASGEEQALPSGEVAAQPAALDNGTPIFFQAPLAAPASRRVLDDDPEPPEVFAPTRPQALLESSANATQGGAASDPSSQGFEPTRPLALLDVDVTSRLSPRDAYQRGAALAKGMKPSLAATAIEAVLREDDFIALDLRRAFEMGLLEGLIDAIPDPDLMQAVIATMQWEPALNPRNEVDARINWLFEGLRIGQSWRELQEQARHQPILALILAGKTPQELGWRRWAPGLRERVGHALVNVNRPEFAAAQRHPQYPDENVQRWIAFAQSHWLGIDPVWPRSATAGTVFGVLAIWLASIGDEERNQPFASVVQWFGARENATSLAFAVTALVCLAMARGSCWLVQMMDPVDQRGESTGPRYARLWTVAALSGTALAMSFQLLPVPAQWFATVWIFIAAWLSWPFLGRGLTVARSICATVLLALVGPMMLGTAFDNPPVVIAFMLAPTLCTMWIFGRGMMQRFGERREAQWSFIATLLSVVLLGAVFLGRETPALVRLALDLGFIVILVGQSHDFLDRLSRMVSAISQTGKFIGYLIAVFVLSFGWFAMVDYLQIDMDKTLLQRSPAWPAVIAVLGVLHAWQWAKKWRELHPPRAPAP
jgi:hypothetical protein